MSRLHPLLLLLTLTLAACGPSGGGGTPPPDDPQAAFFRTQPEFGGPAPAGTVTVTPAQFMDAVKNGGHILTAQDLANEKAAQERQDAQDDADARAYIDLYPDFRAVLQPPAPDAINADGDRLVSVPTAGGSRTVTLMGNAFAKAVLATHARTFPSQTNQYRLYSTLYTDLDITLKKLNNTVQQFGLPAPDEVRNYSADRLRVLNNQASDVIREYGAEIYNLVFLLDPANLETGSKDQLDRTQKGRLSGARGRGPLPELRLAAQAADHHRQGSGAARYLLGLCHGRGAGSRDRPARRQGRQPVRGGLRGPPFSGMGTPQLRRGRRPDRHCPEGQRGQLHLCLRGTVAVQQEPEPGVPTPPSRPTPSPATATRTASVNYGPCSNTTDQSDWYVTLVGGKLYLMRRCPAPARAAATACGRPPTSGTRAIWIAAW